MLKPFLLGALALSCLGSGCTARRPDPQRAAAAAAASALGEDYKATKRDSVPLYRSGPQQLTMADALLPKGTVARVVRTEFGYSLVQTESGMLGWVASEDLGPPAASPAMTAGGAILPAPVNATDAMNATAVARDAGQAPSARPNGGDTAIVARYRVDNPAADNSPPPASPTPKP